MRSSHKEVHTGAGNQTNWFMVIHTKSELVKYYKEMLSEFDGWAIRGLLAVYDKQTADEKQTETTRHSNGVGFRGSDAEFLSSLANRYITRGSLTEKQLATLKKVMPVYAKQLVWISIEIGRIEKFGDYYFL